jgi:hypothetical protein
MRQRRSKHGRAHQGASAADGERAQDVELQHGRKEGIPSGIGLAASKLSPMRGATVKACVAARQSTSGARLDPYPRLHRRPAELR